MGLLTNKFQEDNVIVEKLEKLLNWSRSTSPWFFQFGTACCAIEMMAAAAPWLMGAAVLGKVFKLFNTGGFVGPLGNVSKVKYKTHGGDVTNEYEINMGPLSKGE